MDLDVLIQSELQKGKKVELVLAEDLYEGTCLAIRFQDGREVFLAWESFESIEVDDFLIRKKLVAKNEI